MRFVFPGVVFCIVFLAFLIPVEAQSVTTNDLWRPGRADSYFMGDYNQGYYRMEFDIPAGTIWRAAAEIGEQGILYVNGQKVDFKPDFTRRQGFSEAYMTETADLMPYLIPGQRNSIALFYKGYPERPGDIYGPPWPTTFFQSKVIMSTGQVILLDMEPSNPFGWKSTATEQPGWNTKGFDDSSWDDIVSIGLQRKPLSYVERWPVYDGRLVFENPHPVETQLYYKDDIPVQVNVLIPEGLSGTIHWTLERVNDGGTYTFLSSGSQSSYTNRPSDNSNVYTLDLGIHSRGVYTLEVYLESGGTTIESRMPEPLVVTGRISMTEVDADEIEDGLDLTLEAEIDFTTEPGWIETRKNGRDNFPRLDLTQQIYTPTIVTRNGLTYRETQPDRGSMFSYQYTFQHPGDWYLLALEYPDDARRKIGVAITQTADPPGYNTTAGGWDWVQSGPGIITGLKYPLSGEMKEFKWIHRADPPGNHNIDIVSMMALRPAAARKIRIYHINGNLPALKTSSNQERSIGIHTERARQLGINFGIKNPGSYGWAMQHRTYEELGYDMLQIKTQRILWQLDVLEHYVQYMKFMGQNFHVMGAYQYYHSNTYYTPPDKLKTASVLADIRDTALRVFEANNIEAMSTIEYSNHYAMVNEKEANITVGDPEKYLAVDKDGVKYGGSARIIRITNPDVQQSMLFVMEELAYKFSVSPAWKGMFFIIYPGWFGPSFYSVANRWPPNPDPLDWDYADDVIAEFEKDTGINVPGTDGDPNRFSERHAFLTNSQNRDTWIDWRCDYVRKVALMLRDKIHEYRPDINMIQGYALAPSILIDWLENDRNYLDMLRELGLDPTLYNNDNNMWIAPYMYPTERDQYEFFEYWPYLYYAYTTFWEHHVNPEVLSNYNQNDDKRVVSMVEGWTELSYHYVKDTGLTWPLEYNRGRFQTKYEDRFSQETFAQAMIGSDPQLLIHGFYDIGIGVSHGQELRDFNRVFTALPQEKFQPVLNTGFATNLAIRALQDGGTYWFYVVNPGYWKTTATINLQNINTVTDVATGQTISVPGGSLSFDLEPFGIKAFKALTTNGGINSYSIGPLSENDLTHMRTLISLVKDTYPIISDELDVSAEDEAFIINIADQADQDLANKNYASTWHRVTNWKYWQIAHDIIFREVNVTSVFSSKRTATNKISFDASGSASYRDPLASYEWNFGDGTTGSGETVEHQYPLEGMYTVRLKVSDEYGNTNRLIKNVLATAAGVGNPDLNYDTYVNILDLVLISGNFGRTSGINPPEADTDNSGEVDIYDVVFVASRFGTRIAVGGGTPLPSGQIAYWHFNGTLEDSENNNDGAFYGGTPNYVQGQVGQALKLDGTDDYVEVPHHDSLNPGNEITISTWVKFVQDGTHHPIIAKSDGPGYHLTIVSYPYILLRTSVSGVDLSDVQTGYPDDGEWHHVAGVFSPTKEVIYIDGIEKRNEVPTVNTVGYTDSVLRIGRSTTGWWGGSTRFNGEIDELRIFNRALTAEEIIDVMYHGLPAS